MRDSSSKPRHKFQVRNYEQKKHFKKKPIKEQPSGLSVNVYGDDINKALRIFKKKILKSGILNEMRDRQFFIKKSEKIRLAKSAGKQRWLRKFAETPGPHQYAKNYRKRNRAD